MSYFNSRYEETPTIIYYCGNCKHDIDKGYTLLADLEFEIKIISKDYSFIDFFDKNASLELKKFLKRRKDRSRSTTYNRNIKFGGSYVNRILWTKTFRVSENLVIKIYGFRHDIAVSINGCLLVVQSIINEKSFHMNDYELYYLFKGIILSVLDKLRDKNEQGHIRTVSDLQSELERINIYV